eukprot:gene7371-9958_t
MKARKNDELVFLPLGGSNEIGMNFNLYGYGPEHGRKWIVVDLGITFGDQTTPGVEVILPDPSYIEDYADDILGIVLTHAHEDHIGAVAWLWPRLKAPKLATLFAATPIETLRAYLAFHYINSFAPALSEDWQKLNFAFFGARLSGTPEQQPLKDRAVDFAGWKAGA